MKIIASGLSNADQLIDIVRWVKTERDLVLRDDALVIVREACDNLVVVRAKENGVLAKILVPAKATAIASHAILGVMGLPEDDNIESLLEEIRISSLMNSISGIHLDSELLDEADLNEGEETDLEDLDHPSVIDQPAAEHSLDGSEYAGAQKNALAGRILKAGGLFVLGAVYVVVVDVFIRIVIPQLRNPFFKRLGGSIAMRELQIGSVIERGHGVFYVYDTENRQLGTVTVSNGRLLGYTNASFQIRVGGEILTYNARRQITGRMTA